MFIPNAEDIDALKENPAPTRKQFINIVKTFAYHPEQDELLLTINAYNEKLAETLLIFRKPVTQAAAHPEQLSSVTDLLYLHYVINTTGPINEYADSENFDVFEAATRYADGLNVGLSKDSDGNTVLHIDEKDIPYSRWQNSSDISAALSLRLIGAVINRARYGRDDVIPSHVFGFDENAGSHTLPNAMTMADFAHLAYFKPAYIEKQLIAWGYHDFTWIDDVQSDTQVFLATKGTHVVVCFRGTSSLKDILADLNFLKVTAFGGTGKVHRGFQTALDGVWPRLQSSVDKIKEGKKLFICGHSLGAALAQLAAHRFAIKGYNVADVYVFGSPRVGNREFMELYNTILAEKTFLHINNNDIVTTVPLALLGFHHLGAKPRSFDNGHLISNLDAEPEQGETPYEKLDAETQELIRQKMYEVELSIQAATKFLTRNPNQLGIGNYDTQFNAGAADEHSMDQYLFKFACAILDGAWKRIGENTRSRKTA